METNKPSYKGHYGSSWFILVLLTAIPLTYQYTRMHYSAVSWKPAPISNPGPEEQVPWFFIIKIPEITTQYESGVDIMKTRLTEWLTTLKSEGFHPMLLSDVEARLQKGQGVPERTLVTVFSPGYRRTYEIVSPILTRLEWPAVWLTDEASMNHADRRLVTYHTTRLMKSSGLWDIGFTNGDGRIRLESLRDGTEFLGDAKNRTWSTAGGAFALNHGAARYNMNFLAVNSAWLAPELLNRLLVETPPTGKSVFLTKGIIQGREWGVTLPSERTDLNPHFDLKAPMNRRGTKLFFLGTQGISDFQLHAEAARLVGEFWIQLRVDEAAGYALHVIYTDKAVVVVQQQGDIKKRLFYGPHTGPRNGMALSCDLTIAGTQLRVSFNGGPPLVIDHLAPTVPGHGLLQIYIADKPHGTALAENVSLVFNPLPRSGPTAGTSSL